MTLTQASKLATTLQSLVTTIGIVVGGIWVLYTFWDLGSSQKARLDIVESEQKTLEQPNLSVNFKWDTYGKTSQDKRFVSLLAVLRNDGRRALDVEKITVQVSRLSPTDAVPTTLLELKPYVLDSDGKSHLMPTRTFRVGQARTLALPLPPLQYGNYIIQLRCEYHGLVLKDGQFYPSSDVAVEALEQSIVNVAELM
jgi:hypothetical protein